MKYFDKIFPNTANVDIDSRNYPYSLRNMRKRVSDKTRMESLREVCEDLTVNQACSMKAEALGDGQMGSSLIAGFIPDLFTDSIVQYGSRVAIARRDFPVVPQSSHNKFVHRFMWRHDSCQIIREGDSVLSTITNRDTQDYKFVKIADSSMYTNEFLTDSTISQVSLDLQMSSNKVAMLEDRLMWHCLTEHSSTVNFPQFTPYNLYSSGCDSGDPDDPPNFATLVDRIGNAFLNMTTRLEDSIPASSLRLYVSPDVYKVLWTDDNYRRFDITGQLSTLITGQVPPLFRIPTTIITPGYFDESNNWTYMPWDVYLVGEGAAAIRQRTDMRMSPLEIREREMEGWMMTERIRPYVINPLNFIRISCEGSPSIQDTEDILYRPRDLSKENDPSTLQMTTIET